MHTSQSQFTSHSGSSWQGKTYKRTALPFGFSAAPTVFTKLLKLILATQESDDFLIIGKTKKETVISEDQDVDGEYWICDKQRQITQQGNSDDRVPGVYHWLKEHDIQDDCRMSKANQGEMQTSPGEQSNDTHGISSQSGCVSSHTNSSPAGSPTLWSFAISEERRDIPPLIWCDSDSESSEPGGSSVVKEQFEPGQRRTDSSSTSKDSDRIRCFQHGMESMLQKYIRTREEWSKKESFLHINCKEMLAAFLALQSFVRDKQDVYVRLKVDNITTMYYIKN